MFSPEHARSGVSSIADALVESSSVKAGVREVVVRRHVLAMASRRIAHFAFMASAALRTWPFRPWRRWRDAGLKGRARLPRTRCCPTRHTLGSVFHLHGPHIVRYPDPISGGLRQRGGREARGSPAPRGERCRRCRLLLQLVGQGRGAGCGDAQRRALSGGRSCLWAVTSFLARSQRALRRLNGDRCSLWLVAPPLSDARTQ